MNPGGWWRWAVILVVGIGDGLGDAGKLCWVQEVEEGFGRGGGGWGRGPFSGGRVPTSAGLGLALLNPWGQRGWSWGTVWIKICHTQPRHPWVPACFMAHCWGRPQHGGSWCPLRKQTQPMRNEPPGALLHTPALLPTLGQKEPLPPTAAAPVALLQQDPLQLLHHPGNIFSLFLNTLQARFPADDQLQVLGKGTAGRWQPLGDVPSGDMAQPGAGGCGWWPHLSGDTCTLQRGAAEEPRRFHGAGPAPMRRDGSRCHWSSRYGTGGCPPPRVVSPQHPPSWCWDTLSITHLGG